MTDTAAPQQQETASTAPAFPTRTAVPVLPSGMPPLPARKPVPAPEPVEDPAWWRYGAVPFIVLLLAAAGADLTLDSIHLGLGTSLSCLLLTSAVLLLRKDFTTGEILFLGGVALVNAAAILVSGSQFNFFLGFIIPFVIQLFPSKQEIDPRRRFRTWWGFWVAHRKQPGEKGKFSQKLRSIMPLLVSILVGAILFIAFLTIFATGNPVVEMVWEYIVETWNKIVAYFHLDWDILIHILYWCIGILVFGLFTLRRPSLCNTGTPAKPAEGQAGSTVLPYLPICSLIGVDLAFLIATSTDIAYLWFGKVPEGVSQTAYLHDGAASISWAAGLAAVLLVFFFRKNGSARRSAGCKFFGYLLVVQTFLLAVSVYMRLYYQISDFGFTIRRIMAAEALLLGLAGLVVLVFYMASSGSFGKYAKICMGTMLVMLVAFGICSPARLAGHLNLRYMDTHPQWSFSLADFSNGRFIIGSNLEFAYKVYEQDPSNEVFAVRLYWAAMDATCNGPRQENGWKNWCWADERDKAIAEHIIHTLKPDVE